MKAFKFILVSLLIAGTLASCEKDFDPQIYGSFNTTTTPASVSDVENIVATCYLPFASFWNYTYSQKEICWNNPNNGVLCMFDATTDLMAKSTFSNNVHNRFSGADYSDAHLFTRSGAGDNNLNHLHGVTDVSAMTKYIDVIENCDCISDEQKAKYIGEMRLCRGLSMYYVLNCYGPLPFVLEADQLKDTSYLYKLERPSLDQVTEWITDDFEYAVEHIWKKGELKQNGRYNADYAKVCLARHYLNEGYHQTGYYEKAARLCKEIIDSGNYSLYSQTTKVNPYVDQFLAGNGFNCEVIAAIDVTDNSTNAVNGYYNCIAIYAAGPKWAAFDATHNPNWGVCASSWGYTYNVAPKFFHTFEGGDLRKECIDTTYIASAYYKYREITEADIKGGWWDGFHMNKYRPHQKGAYQNNDIPLARYADVLLLYAEAVARSTGAASAAAVDAVNKVRARAGLPGLGADKTASKDAFLDAILMERGHELFFEGFRKMDLIRFNKYAVNCAMYKDKLPTHQYLPMPDYTVNQAAEHGCTLTQTYEREGWTADYAAAQQILK